MDRGPSEIGPTRRSLTDAERRSVSTEIRRLAALGRSASKAHVPAAGAVIVVLWLWTLLATDAGWLVVSAFWAVVGGAIALWAGRAMRVHAAQFEGMARNLESALRRDTADVYDVRARAFAEVEEIEDEGACYVFDVGDDRLAFVYGQEFYEDEGFPSLDFSLVYLLDEAGRTVYMLMDRRGAKAEPTRTIPAAVKRTLDLPEHLEVRTGALDDFEISLRASDRGR